MSNQAVLYTHYGALSAAELCTSDGSGDGHVETLGGIVGAITRNEKAMVDLLTNLGGDTVAFVAHHDEPVRGERLGVDIVTVEQCAIDRIVVG